MPASDEHILLDEGLQVFVAVLIVLEVILEMIQLVIDPDTNLLDRVAHAILDEEVLEDGSGQPLTHLHLNGSVGADVEPVSQECNHLFSAPEVTGPNCKVDRVHNAIVEHCLRCQELLKEYDVRVINKIRINVHYNLISAAS